MPAAPRPPATSIRPPIATAARSLSGAAQPPAGADAAARQIDGDDPRGRRVRGPPAAADHEHRPPIAAAAACVVGAGRLADRGDAAASRVEGEDGAARGAVGQRPARDHEPAAAAVDRGVAHRRRQMRDDACRPRRAARRRSCRASGCPCSRRRRTRSADRGGRLVGARRRQAPARPSTRRPRSIRTISSSWLRSVAAAEQVGGAAEPHRGGVVERAGSRPSSRPPLGPRRDRVRRGVGAVSPGEQDVRAAGARRGGVLQRCRHPRRVRDAELDLRPGRTGARRLRAVVAVVPARRTVRNVGWPPRTSTQVTSPSTAARHAEVRSSFGKERLLTRPLSWVDRKPPGRTVDGDPDCRLNADAHPDCVDGLVRLRSRARLVAVAVLLVVDDDPTIRRMLERTLVAGAATTCGSQPTEGRRSPSWSVPFLICWCWTLRCRASTG